MKVAIDKFVVITEADSEWVQEAEDGEFCPRAEIQIGEDCPHAIRHHLMDAQKRGYLKVVAYVPEAQIALEMMARKND